MFTYDVSSDAGLVRLDIGDTQENCGPLPNDANFSDEEINALIQREGSVKRASAAALEILSARWASYVDIDVGPHAEKLSQASKAFADRAAVLRKQYGYGADASDEAGGGTIATGFIRDDVVTNEYGRNWILTQP